MTNIYEVSSTQIEVSGALKDKLIDFGKMIPDEELHDWGREDTPHITIKFGITSDDERVVSGIDGLKNFTNIVAHLGKTSAFESENYDVLKFDVYSTDLRKLNSLIASNTETIDTFPTYSPHLTIAYLKKGYIEKYLGMIDFYGVKIETNTIVFSSLNGTKTMIKL